MTELEQLPGNIACRKAKGVAENACGGSEAPYDPDKWGLSEFMEYICVWRSRNRPDWPEPEERKTDE